ncbi:MAG TPA: Hsp70 family protein, partial [Terriglobales bacterium]|nr:Hsp70 family protein [Terriglobales bacterium]
MLAVGIDFGTTNSAVAIASADQEPVLATFAWKNRRLPTFRSVLYFERIAAGTGQKIAVHTGPDALERHVHGSGEGRFMQSLKTFLASRLTQSTNVFGHIHTLESLVGLILSGLRDSVSCGGPAIGGAAVAGRPVRFAGSTGETDDERALERLRRSFALAGFEDVRFEYEPVGAAYHFARRAGTAALALIADFGGGTSDFSVVKLSPRASRAGLDTDVLGSGGVGIAGDAFDARIIRHLVSPMLGSTSEYKDLFGKRRPVPAWLFSDLEQWHRLSFLNSPATQAVLQTVRQGALEPEKLEAFDALIANDLAYELHEAVEAVKVALSTHEVAEFSLIKPPLRVTSAVTRKELEAWIAR